MGIQVIERGLTAAAKLQGTAGMRGLFMSLQGSARLGEAAYLSVLDMEQGQADDSRVETIFEAAVRECGDSSPALWLRFLAFKAAQGRGVGQVQWRATRALKDSSAFVAAAAGIIAGPGCSC